MELTRPREPYTKSRITFVSSHDDALLALDDALHVVGAALVVALLLRQSADLRGRPRRRGRDGSRRRESHSRVVIRICKENVRTTVCCIPIPLEGKPLYTLPELN